MASAVTLYGQGLADLEVALWGRMHGVCYELHVGGAAGGRAGSSISAGVVPQAGNTMRSTDVLPFVLALQGFLSTLQGRRVGQTCLASLGRHPRIASRLHNPCHDHRRPPPSLPRQSHAVADGGVQVALPLLVRCGLLQLEAAAEGGAGIGPPYPLLVLPCERAVAEVHGVASAMGPARWDEVV